jgi:MFS family permease
MLCPVLLVVLLMTNTVAPWMVVASSLVVGITDALSMPSFQTIVPSIVRRAQIGAGLALNATQFNLSRLLGPTLAGVLMASVGVIACFAVNAASYLPFIGVALWILPRRSAPLSARRKPRSPSYFFRIARYCRCLIYKRRTSYCTGDQHAVRTAHYLLPGACKRCPAWKCPRVQPSYWRVWCRRLAGCRRVARRPT